MSASYISSTKSAAGFPKEQKKGSWKKDFGFLFTIGVFIIVMAILFFNEQDKKQSSHTETTGQSHELDTQISVSSGLERSNVIFISNVGNNTTVHALGKAGADPYSFSGDYYLLMQKAVKAFQRKNGLTVDGKLGSNTWSRLRIEAGLAKPEPVHEPGDTWRELTPGTVFAGRCQMEKQLGQGGHG